MIIGIDPGTTESGIVVIDNDYTVVSAEKELNENIAWKWLDNESIIRDQVDTVVIEAIQSYGMAVGASVFTTCFWIGRFWQKALEGNVDVFLYSRPKIFRGVVGQSKGGDAAMRQALLTRFGGDKKGEPLNILKGGGSDKRSAFAAAVYHLDGAKLGEW